MDLVGVETEEEAVRLVRERAEEVPAGSWIEGRGWDEGAWANRYPDRRLLSEAVPDHPVWLRGLHGFAGWANQMALDEAVPPRTPQEVRARVEAALEELASAGYTVVHDAGTQAHVLDVLQTIEAEGSLPIRSMPC